MTASLTTDALWPIPAGLSDQGQTAAEVIRSFFDEKDIVEHGGGGKFYTPEEWADRGEQYGRRSVLVITHDGGDHAAALNMDYGAYRLLEDLAARLRGHGLYLEQCTSWYSAVYPT